MMLIMKATCLAIYALGLAGLAGSLPDPLAGSMQRIAAVMLIIHALEAIFMFKRVRLYRGALAVSIGLTMLFGLLHLKPLADTPAGKKSGL